MSTMPLGSPTRKANLKQRTQVGGVSSSVSLRNVNENSY